MNDGPPGLEIDEQGLREGLRIDAGPIGRAGKSCRIDVNRSVRGGSLNACRPAAA